MKRGFVFLMLFFIWLPSLTQEIELELHASDFFIPTDLRNAGDDRLFVVEQFGLIKILNSDGSVNTEPFLDANDVIFPGGEGGLMSLVFHPDYSSNGYFYIYYFNDFSETVLSRYQVSSDNPDIADPSSRLDMLTITQPDGLHNGGGLQFGPDGYLYLGTGDGGGSGDPDNNSQNLGSLLGKIIRLDVDASAPYIPVSNPYIADPDALDEIYAFGLRNPWKISIDYTTSDLWIADVGQTTIEEINKVSIEEAPLNYGWRCYEGTAPFNLTDCPNAKSMTFPVSEYVSSSTRCAIIGGYVYRGAEFPGLQNLYFFGDYCGGEIGVVDTDYSLSWIYDSDQQWTSFGEDLDKNLYILSRSGNIYRILDSTLSTNEQMFSNSITWHQNNVDAKIVFESSNHDISKIDLYAINGVRVKTLSTKGRSHASFDTSNLPLGVYIAKVTSIAGQVKTIKLVIH